MTSRCALDRAIDLQTCDAAVVELVLEVRTTDPTTPCFRWQYHLYTLPTLAFTPVRLQFDQKQLSITNWGHLLRFTSLKSLDLSKCTSLPQLPEEVCKLTSLQTLCLRGCSSITVLPETIAVLDELQQLDLSGCSSLTSLPESLGGCMSCNS
jgi:hypothetical protein